jgi:hypothetical protein
MDAQPAVDQNQARPVVGQRLDLGIRPAPRDPDELRGIGVEHHRTLIPDTRTRLEDQARSPDRLYRQIIKVDDFWKDRHGRLLTMGDCVVKISYATDTITGQAITNEQRRQRAPAFVGELGRHRPRPDGV